jgi:hypothetical protein
MKLLKRKIAGVEAYVAKMAELSRERSVVIWSDIIVSFKYVKHSMWPWSMAAFLDTQDAMMHYFTLFLGWNDNQVFSTRAKSANEKKAWCNDRCFYFAYLSSLSHFSGSRFLCSITSNTINRSEYVSIVLYMYDYKYNV